MSLTSIVSLRCGLRRHREYPRAVDMEMSKINSTRFCFTIRITTHSTNTYGTNHTTHTDWTCSASKFALFQLFPSSTSPVKPFVGSWKFSDVIHPDFKWVEPCRHSCRFLSAMWSAGSYVSTSLPLTSWNRNIAEPVLRKRRWCRR
jgi:hypothetical protein